MGYITFSIIIINVILSLSQQSLIKRFLYGIHKKDKNMKFDIHVCLALYSSSNAFKTVLKSVRN